MTRVSEIDLEAQRACPPLNFAVGFCLFWFMLVRGMVLGQTDSEGCVDTIPGVKVWVGFVG